MILYTVDTTINPVQVKKFNSYNEILSYLDGMSKRQYGKNRKQRMIMLEELGHGYDDNDGINFVRTMAQEFEIGLIRENNRMRCDITTAEFFKKEEFGN